MNNDKYNSSYIKTLIGNGSMYKISTSMTDIVKRNNDLYEGKNTKSFFKTIPGLNFNYCRTIIDNFAATISDLNPKLYCNITTNSEIIDRFELAMMEKAINMMLNNILETNNNVIMNLEMVKRACIDGTSFLHFYYDDSVSSINLDGSKFSSGKIKFEILDVLQVSVSNVYDFDLQNNDWISISNRVMISDLKNTAKHFRAHGTNTLSDEEIENLGRSNYELNNNILNDDYSLCDVITFYYKDYETNTIHKKIIDYSSLAEVCGDIDTELKLFPFANFNWSTRKGSYYGQSPIDDMAPIQMLINLLTSVVCMQKLMDIPRLVANSRKININTISNNPAEIIVTNSNDSVGNDIQKLQSSNQSSEALSFISLLKSELMNIAGYNSFDVNKITFDSSKSLLYAKEILDKPLSNVKKFYSYTMTCIARIIIDYYINYFKNDAVQELKITNDNGELINYRLDLSTLNNASFNFRIDYSTSSIYNDDNVMATLINLIQSGLIPLQPEDIVKLIPQNVLPSKEDILQALEKYKKDTQTQIPGTNETDITIPTKPSDNIVVDDSEINNLISQVTNDNSLGVGA